MCVCVDWDIFFSPTFFVVIETFHWSAKIFVQSAMVTGFFISFNDSKKSPRGILGWKKFTRTLGWISVCTAAAGSSPSCPLPGLVPALNCPRCWPTCSGRATGSHCPAGLWPSATVRLPWGLALKNFYWPEPEWNQDSFSHRWTKPDTGHWMMRLTKSRTLSHSVWTCGNPHPSSREIKKNTKQKLNPYSTVSTTFANRPE